MVIISIAESGSVDLAQFTRSPEYAALKALFEESFLGNQQGYGKVPATRMVDGY